MDYRAIRNVIVKGLYEFLKVDIVPTDTVNKKPKYPYLSYKFTSLYIPQGSHNLLFDVVSAEDIETEYTREEQPKMVVSISSYSNDEIEVYDLALKARQWFEFNGYYDLKDYGIIVAKIGNVQDRTVKIVDNYEKRQGFDVTIRVMDIQKLRIESIEKASMNRR